MGLSLAPQDSVCCAVQHLDSSKIKVLLCHQNLADIVDWYSSMINFLESVCVSKFSNLLCMQMCSFLVVCGHLEKIQEAGVLYFGI